jgi:hypothetical protein
VADNANSVNARTTWFMAPSDCDQNITASRRRLRRPTVDPSRPCRSRR